MEGYAEALDMVTRNYSSLKFTSKYKNLQCNEDVVVIRYMYAKSCIDTNNYDSIINGLKQLDEIQDKHKVKFPAIHLGYTNSFKKLNRYDKALHHAQK